LDSNFIRKYAKNIIIQIIKANKQKTIHNNNSR